MPDNPAGPRRNLISCDLSPAQLATWALAEARVRPPVPSVTHVAQVLGIARVEESAELTKAGCLDVDRGDVVVRVRPGNPRWQRFTLAHELGHYLLAVHQGIPLAEQLGDRRAERYCNSFASHFLLPRPWLRSAVPTSDPSLENLLSLADDADCTAATAMAALIDAKRWNAILAVWRLEGGEWRVQTCLRPETGLRLAADPNSADVLNAAPRGSTTRAHLPLIADGKRVIVEVEMTRQGVSVITLTGDTDLLSPGPRSTQQRGHLSRH